jgi:hypothetical protein
LPDISSTTNRYAHVVKRLSPRTLSSLPRNVSIASSAD